MAGKTIRLDAEAYDRLKRAKRDDESFSETIKRVVREPFDAEGFLNDLRGLSDETMEAVEEAVRARGSGGNRGHRDGML